MGYGIGSLLSVVVATRGVVSMQSPAEEEWERKPSSIILRICWNILHAVLYVTPVSLWIYFAKMLHG